jgi:alcohol dehydrogenase class IV
MRVDFQTAGRILFGPGVSAEAPELLAAFGPRALVVHGAQPHRAAPLLDALAARGVAVTCFPVAAEPTIALATQGAALARHARVDVVAGIGGGSVLDTAKAIAALAANPGDALTYLEVIGAAQPLPHPPLPVVALPTTAGAGSEVTRNAVLHSPQHALKVSLRHPGLLPRLAIVDPNLTQSAPPALRAATGLDALTQLIEPYVSLRANPLTDAFCRQGIPLAARAVVRVVEDASDHQALCDMSFAALLGGLALASAGLGAVHGFAAAIGGQFPAPHGAICAALLPAVIHANVHALQQRAPSSHALSRYAEIAAWLTHQPAAPPQAAAPAAAHLIRRLHIPTLSAWGVRPADIPLLAARAAQASSMKPNPILLTSNELENILAAAL